LKNLKILHVSTAISWRGGEQQIEYLIEGQIQNQCLPYLFCASQSEMEKHAKDKGFHCFSHPKKSSLDIKFVQALAKRIKSLAPNLIHAHDSHAHTFVVLAFVFYRIKLPIVLHRRVDFPVSNNLFSKFKYNFKHIKKIICVSDLVKNILDESLVDKNKSVTVYSGIDFKRFESDNSLDLRMKLKVPSDAYLIAHIGALEQQKDYFTFIYSSIEVLKQTKNTQIYFVGFGEGSQRQKLEQIILESGFQDRILLPGFFPHIQGLLSQLNQILFTSEMEGLGTSLIDAMYAHLPIVASRVGGIPELITHKDHGLLCGVRDVNAFVSSTIYLYENESIRNTIALSAQQKAKKFSKQNMVQGVMEVYKEILG